MFQSGNKTSFIGVKCLELLSFWLTDHHHQSGEGLQISSYLAQFVVDILIQSSRRHRSSCTNWPHRCRRTREVGCRGRRHTHQCSSHTFHLWSQAGTRTNTPSLDRSEPCTGLHSNTDSGCTMANPHLNNKRGFYAIVWYYIMSLKM